MRAIFTILFVGLTLAVPPTRSLRSAGEAPSDQDAARRLKSFLSAAEKEGFRGTVLVARGGKVLLEEGYGFAEPVGKAPMKSDTVMTIGSVTKQFTAAGILVLEQDGRLSVNDRITKHFKKVPSDKKGITLHHLLTHTSGLPGAIGNDREKVGRDEYLRRALTTELMFEPGERYEYSNVGYSLLAAIIEQQSGKGYETFMRQRLFLPAGMKDTGYVLPEWPSARLAHALDDEGGDWGTMVARMYDGGGPGWHLVGNGGMHSTPRDMYRWHQALTGEQILTAASKKKMYGRHADEGGSWYGYGWSIENTAYGELVTHNGGNPYFFSDFLRYPESDTVIFYSSGSRDRRMNRMARLMAGILFEGDEPELPAARAGRPMQTDGPTAQAGSPAERWGLPGSFRGNRAAQLLDAIVSTDEGARRTFVDQGFSPGSIERNGKEGLMGALDMLKEELGTFSLAGARPSGSSGVEVILDSDAHGGNPVTLILTLEAGEPHRIESIGVEVGG